MNSLPDGVDWIPVPLHADVRGLLAAFDSKTLPLEPVRTFVITNVPHGATRGGHDKKNCVGTGANGRLFASALIASISACRS